VLFEINRKSLPFGLAWTRDPEAPVKAVL